MAMHWAPFDSPTQGLHFLEQGLPGVFSAWAWGAGGPPRKATEPHATPATAGSCPSDLGMWGRSQPPRALGPGQAPPRSRPNPGLPPAPASLCVQDTRAE